MPTVFDSFKQSSLTWFFQVKFESKVTPKYLTEETSWMFTPSIFRFNDLYGLSLLEWKRTKLVFKIPRASLLDLIHSATAWSFWFRIKRRMDPWGTPQVVERESELIYGHLYNTYKLFCIAAIRQIWLKPVIGFTSHSLMIQFW